MGQGLVASAELLCLPERWCQWSGQERYTVIALIAEVAPTVCEHGAVLRGLHIPDGAWYADDQGIASDDCSRYLIREYASHAQVAWEKAEGIAIEQYRDLLAG